MLMMITIPHSGEMIPEEALWLKNLEPRVLLTDVDRFVHELYRPGCELLEIPYVKCEVHRYVVDLNRVPEDIDETIVAGAKRETPLKYVSGIHWKKTTQGFELLKKPMDQKTHEGLIQKYYFPFHAEVKKMEKSLLAKKKEPRFHLDVHSMPSKGTGSHKDAGSLRPDIVVSDCDGKSSSAEFKDRVIDALSKLGFQVAYNWPYKGGRMTEAYGHPAEGRHSLQIELNRALYMDEVTKEKKDSFADIQKKITLFLTDIKKFK